MDLDSLSRQMKESKRNSRLVRSDCTVQWVPEHTCRQRSQKGSFIELKKYYIKITNERRDWLETSVSLI